MISRLMLAGLLALCLHPARAAPRVVVSIKPIEAIVAGLMAGIGRPRLLLPGGASPHSYSLRPSDARALRRAQVVVWIGPALETFLVKPLRVLAGGATTVTLQRVPRLVRHRIRAAGLWEAHHHDGGQKPHSGGDGHDLDPHLWMDPQNGMRFAAAIARALIDTDPGNAARYGANLRATLARIRAADRRIRTLLAPVRRRPYIVFHDAFQYFEKRFRLAGVGSITLEGRTPGARRISRIRSRIRRQQVRCVFVEPQFPPRLARTVVAGTSAKLASVDPVGARLPGRGGDYVRLLLNAAAALSRCLR